MSLEAECSTRKENDIGTLTRSAVSPHHAPGTAQSRGVSYPPTPHNPTHSPRNAARTETPHNPSKQI